MPLTVTNTPQARLQYSTEEYCQESPVSYYHVTDDTVIHYSLDAIVRYRRSHVSKSLEYQYWTNRDRALRCPRCGRHDLELFATRLGHQLIIEPFKA